MASRLLERLGIPSSHLGVQYVKNTSLVGVGNILESLISYVIVVLISRYLGVEGFGQYSFLFSFVALFFLVSDLGMSTLLVKELPDKKEDQEKYLSNILSVKLFIGIFILLIYMGVCLVIGKENLLIPLILVGISQFFGMFNITLFSLLRVKNEAVQTSVAVLIERVLSLIGAIILLPMTASLTHFMALLTFTMLVRTIYLFIITRRLVRIRFVIDVPFLKRFITESLPFMGIKIFSVIYVRVDTVMLSFMISDVVVGWYNAPYRLINVLDMFTALLLTFSFPMISRLHKKNPAASYRIFKLLLFTSLALILPIVVGVWMLGDRILDFIYHFDAIEAFIAFKILIVTQVFIFITTIAGNYISATYGQKIFARIAGVGAAFNLILNFLLIPRYSLYGAGVATLATYLLMAVLMGIYLRKNSFGLPSPKPLLIPSVSTAITWLVLSSILSLNLILIVAICGAVYAAAFVALSLVFKEWSLLPLLRRA